MARIFVLLSFIGLVLSSTYTVSVKRINNNQPVISSQYHGNGSSPFLYNYNAAFVSILNQSTGKQVPGLLVRCQNITNPTDPYSVGPSVIVYAKMVSDLSDPENVVFEELSVDEVVIQPDNPSNAAGTEDPRAIYREADNTYYVLYSAVAFQGKDVISRLALATTQSPSDPSTYNFLGAIFPEIRWSKSGALLVRDGYPGPHYLYWGDTTTVQGVSIATTSDLHNFTDHGLWLPTRPNSWDSALVESGPMPLPLSDGNYLFLYNSGRSGYPSPKPKWDIQYNVGFVIISQDDPTKILQRSDEPILSPVLDWEIGKAPYLGLTPNVVFVEGWTPIPNKPDTFMIFYGAADSCVGAAILTVEIN